MANRRQFIQTCLSVLVAASLPSPSNALPVADQSLHPIVEKVFTTQRQIKLIGVGGGGSNAARHMIDSGVLGIEYIFANTDTDALNRCGANKTIQLHRKTLSARTKLGRCRETAELAANDIRSAIGGAHKLFITVGMGGGTGTEAAPVIARIAKEMGIVTVAVVIMPFSWEGPRRIRYADIGLTELQAHVDTLIVLPNDKLLEVWGEDARMSDAFDYANEMTKETVIRIAKI
jgi:cell division protein FtsZ